MRHDVVGTVDRFRSYLTKSSAVCAVSSVRTSAREQAALFVLSSRRQLSPSPLRSIVSAHSSNCLILCDCQSTPQQISAPKKCVRANALTGAAYLAKFVHCSVKRNSEAHPIIAIFYMMSRRDLERLGLLLLRALPRVTRGRVVGWKLWLGGCGFDVVRLKSRVLDCVPRRRGRVLGGGAAGPAPHH